MLTQTTAASMSFVSSLAAVAVMIARSARLSKNGETNPARELMASPYRRIIFGLSIADLLSSLGLFTGPFAAPSSTPQALWGVGGVNSCRVNGVVTILGSTMAPMYILMLSLFCLHTVRKKNSVSVTNHGYPVRLEVMAHAFIIVFNVSLCIAGLLTKSVNTYVTGTGCGFATYPTGCRQRPDIFGECEGRVAHYVSVFTFISSIGVPFVCLVGIITSMCMICWHVFQRNRFFKAHQKEVDEGPSKTSSAPRRKRVSLQKSASMEDNDVIDRYNAVRKKNRAKNIMKLTSPIDDEDPSERSSELKHLYVNLHCPQHPQSTLSASLHEMKETVKETLCDNEEGSKDQHDVENTLFQQEIVENTSTYQEDRDSEKNHEEKANDFDEEERGNDKYTIALRKSSSFGPDGAARQAEASIRIYSRDIVVQAFLFIFAFFVTFIFWWSALLILIVGKRDSPMFLQFLAAFFYPLGGVLNILVYTRPKVRSLIIQQKSAGNYHSWFHAFFLVVKGGVVVPKANAGGRHVMTQEVVKSNQFRAKGLSPAYVGTNSDCQCGGSQSFGDENVAYRQEEDWSHEDIGCRDNAYFNRLGKIMEDMLVEEGRSHNEEEDAASTEKVTDVESTDPLARAYARAFQRAKELH